MGQLGVQELILILIIALLVFGPKKLPELGSGLGKAIKDFKKAMNETTSDAEEHAKESNPEKAHPPQVPVSDKERRQDQ